MLGLAALVGLLVGLVLGALLAARAGAGLVPSLRAELAVERERRAAAETGVALARQAAAQAEARMADWEATRAELLRSSQSAVLVTAQQLSSKLIDDHRRETAEAKAESERRVRQTAEALRQEVQQVADGIAQLKGQVGEKAAVLDTVWRALSSPGGAGYFAEVGLANTLRSFGLVEERDFRLQATLHEEGARKRPDALVFLPGDAVLVIDAKASKHLLELAQAEGGEGEAEAYRRLARSMNQHLKDLTDRDYRSAVEQSWRRAGRGGTIARLLTVMYLPNEGALEKLARADPGFMQRAAQAQITPVGPAGLASMIGFASVEISLIRQIENQERIVEASERLLESLAVAVGHAAGVGRGVKAAADAFARLAASLNGRLLPRARELQRLGLRPAKPVPPNLPGCQLVELAAEAVEEDSPGPADARLTLPPE